MVSDFIALYGSIPAAWLPSAGRTVQYSPLIPHSEALEAQPDAALASMIMLAPAGTTDRRYALAQALRVLRVGGALTVLAPRDKGGARIAKELETFGCDVREDSKNHYRICHTTRPSHCAGLEDAMEEGASRVVDGVGWTQPGVFSWNRVDAGSALLVKYLPALAGQGADLGAGIGYLSRAVLASPSVTQLHLVELDRRALEQAARNVDAARTTLHWQDVRAFNGASPLDFVVMNPPFHDGGIEDRALGEQFIQRAAGLLRAGGTCWMVANRHLPYEAVMRPLFSRITLHAEASGFKIYEAVK